MKISIELPDGFLDPEPKTLIVTKARKRLWAVALDLLAQLDRVCRKYNIRYFCDGGTSLGAARHKGFVPWDDDLDIIMAREEYNRLNAVASSEFAHPYFWQTNETDPGSARGHAQLRNSETTGILKSEMKDGRAIYGFNQGLFIDIFPFDHIPDDPEERRRFIAEMQCAKSEVAHVRLDRQFASELRKTVSLRTLCHGFKPLLREWLAECRRTDRLTAACRKLDALAQKYNMIPTRDMAPVSFKPDHREVLPTHYFDEAEYLDFEFIKIPVLRHYRDALTVNYGDWEQHVIGVSVHGGMFVDTEHPYTDYLPK